MITVKFNTTHQDGMTEATLVGQPLRVNNVEIGKIAAAKLSGLSTLMWELTAEIEMELEVPSTSTSVRTIPFAIQEPRLADDPNVVKFLLSNRNPEFIDRLDYAKMARQIKSELLHVLEDSGQLNVMTHSYRPNAVVGVVVAIEQIADSLVVAVRFKDGYIQSPSDRSLAYNTHRLTRDPSTPLCLGWAGMLTSGGVGKHATSCFYLCPEEELNPR